LRRHYEFLGNGFKSGGLMAIAWLEEWMSWRAYNILPYLASRFDIVYITSGREIPPAKFKDVIQFPKRRYMNLCGFDFAPVTERLYRQGVIDFACEYSNIGFALSKTPCVHIIGGCYLEDHKILASMVPWYKKPKFIKGYVHYVIPERLSVKKARCNIAVSQAVKEQIIRCYNASAGKIPVVYNGVGKEYLDIFAQKSFRVNPKLVYVGRLHPRKGVLPLLKEFSARRDINMDFLVVGSGPDLPVVQRLASRDTRLKIVGELNRNDLLSILHDTSVFIFPSYNEGCPNTLLEAMASGHACLYFDIQVNKEIAADTGIAISFLNNKLMIDRLKQLIENPHEIKIYACKAHERAKWFSWERCAMGFENILNEVYVELGKSNKGS